MAAAGAAEDSLPGAKKIFYDTTSDVQLKENSPAATKKGTAPVHPNPLAKTATGLMYSIELQTPDGKMTTVPSNYVFHTGDRIRLHIKSNVDGKLVVMLSQDQGPYRLLFPPNPATDNRVKKLADNIFPPKFFRFDQNPGDVSLMLMLTADGATPNMVAVTALMQVAPSQQPQPDPVAPVRAPNPPASNPELRAQYEAQVRAEYLKSRDSKGLVMDDDINGPDHATTVVSVPWRDSNITPGVLVVEVRLKHKP
jgi:hypothetical protein